MKRHGLLALAFAILLVAAPSFAVVVAVDDFSTQQTSKGSPSFDHAALVTPSNTDDLAHVARGVLISVDGALKVDTMGGETVTFPTGTFLVKTVYLLRVRRVYSTGTTATGVVTFW